MHKTLRIALVAAAVVVSSATFAAESPGHPPVGAQNAGPAIFATVNGKPITVAEFDAAARESYRRKFYHGQPPENEVNDMMREVGQGLIDRILLAAEVERQKVQPDRAAVDKELAGYEQRYGTSPQWQAQREATLPKIREYLETQSRLAKLEAKVRDVPAPKDKALRAYYAENKSLFTEPEKIRVSLITFRVDPSSPTSVWESTRKVADKVREEIVAGEDFADAAREHSSDESAAKGGDMGYLHRGMLTEDVHLAIDKMKVGEISPAIRSLEGFVLVKLTDRTESKLRSFDDVKPRAAELWRRAEAERAWQAYLGKIRKAAKVKVEAPFQFFMAGTAPTDKK